MSTSSGSRVRRDGTIAMSSKPYAWRAFLPEADLDFHATQSPWMKKPRRTVLAWAQGRDVFATTLIRGDRIKAA